MVAALAALAAIWQSNASKVAERKAKYYDRIVVEPIARQLDLFEAHIAGVLPGLLSEVYDAIESDQRAKTGVHPKRRAAVKAFQSSFRPLKLQIRASADHLGCDDSGEELKTLSETFEEELVEEISISTARRGSLSIDSIELSFRTAVLKVVWARDPSNPK